MPDASLRRKPVVAALWFVVMAKWVPKINHFAARTIENRSAPGAEAILTEIVVIILLVIFGFRGYETGLALLFIPCWGGAFFVSVTLLYQIYLDIRLRLALRSSDRDDT